MITLTQEEYLTTSIHLNIMKKAVKKGLKASYQSEYKDYWKAFKSGLKKLNDQHEEEKEFYQIELSDDEQMIIGEFLTYYSKELEPGADSEEKMMSLEQIRMAARKIALPKEEMTS